VRLPSLDKFGTIGAAIAALACPICFPKLAFLGAALGFGFLAPFEGAIALGVQALFLVAMAGHVRAYRRHRNRWLLAVTILAVVLLFAGYYVIPSSILLQIALLMLVAATVWLTVELRRSTRVAI
jgi:mercuric ion transport protein